MIGKRYSKVIEELIINRGWRFLDCQIDNYTKLMKYNNKETIILEIEYDDADTITGTFKYAYGR